MEIKQEKSCGCIIINNDKVLLVKHNQGHWDFPKGHVEKGETEVETAIREVKEETNLDVSVQKERRYVVEYYPEENIKKEVVYFLATNTSSEVIPQESEIEKIEWVKLDEAENKITYNTSKELIKEVIKEITKNNC